MTMQLQRCYGSVVRARGPTKFESLHAQGSRHGESNPDHGDEYSATESYVTENEQEISMANDISICWCPIKTLSN